MKPPKRSTSLLSPLPTSFFLSLLFGPWSPSFCYTHLLSNFLSSSLVFLLSPSLSLSLCLSATLSLHLLLHSCHSSSPSVPPSIHPQGGCVAAFMPAVCSISFRRFHLISLHYRAGLAPLTSLLCTICCSPLKSSLSFQSLFFVV